MGRNSWFEFKQFRIEQHKAAMKVGTDGVILGAWASVDNTSRILDIGTGTGLISLMLAQRCQAIIDAVEIDKKACEEAFHNFEQSSWKDRLNVYHSDFRSYSNNDELYDLIVSNPPFFIDSLKSYNSVLSLARHNDSLTFEQLIEGACKRLNPYGKLAVIIPFESLDLFRETARLTGFYLHRRTDVISKPGRQPIRSLLEFSLMPAYLSADQILIQDEEGKYTALYKELTSPFYLNF